MTPKGKLWEDLRQKLERVLQKRGAKIALARKIGVSPSSVSEWLAGVSTPTAEAALFLQEWVPAEEARQKASRELVSPSPRQKAQKRKHEKHQSKIRPPQK
jgi:DNA-binding transcriptional regulator YdaS (Cro superfamily)